MTVEPASHRGIPAYAGMTVDRGAGIYHLPLPGLVFAALPEEKPLPKNRGGSLQNPPRFLALAPAAGWLSAARPPADGPYRLICGSI